VATPQVPVLVEGVESKTMQVGPGVVVKEEPVLVQRLSQGEVITHIADSMCNHIGFFFPVHYIYYECV
jgi:hypothetical protein